MHFLHPWYFLILIPIGVILLLLYIYGWRKKYFQALDDILNVFWHSTYYYRIYYLLIFFVCTFFISIFAQPVIEDTKEKQKKNGIDIQIVLDVSYSMIAEDLSPNRLEVAKDVIGNFLEKIQSDRVWIIVFAWKTFTSLPLSFDYSIIKKIVWKINIETINQRNMTMQWTALWDALILATDSFWENNDREKVIILLTDGEANRWLNPIQALAYIQNKNANIKVYTIWIGWWEATSIKIKDAFWSYQVLPVAWVDEETLKTIAAKTWWKFFMAQNREMLENIFSTISQLEKNEIESEILKVNKEKYWVFLYVLIAIFLLLLWLKFRKKI